MIKLKHLFMAMLLMMFASCEKYIAEEDGGKSSSVVNGNLVVTAECPVTRAGENGDEESAIPLKDRFARMSFMLYQDDVRVDYVNQDTNSDNFGTMSVDLDPGTYQLVVLAHSGQRSPTTTNCHKISFSAPLTDVFYYYGDVTVTEQANAVTVQLKRAVAKVQISITDEIKADVNFFNFSYKGASVSFDAATGIGIASSTRRNVQVEKEEGISTFDIFTFVTGEEHKIDLDVTAYSEDAATVLGAKKFSDVPVEVRKVTKIETPLFDGVIEGPTDITVTVDDAWEGTIDYPI